MQCALKIINISVPERATNTPCEDQILKALIDKAKNEFPGLEGNHIVLPHLDNENYEISLYGSSNQAVIDKDGNVFQPLEDMKVNLFYRITDKASGNSLETDQPIVVMVTGAYQDADFNRPQIIPGIREWKGNAGVFHFSGNIIVKEDISEDTARQVKFYIEQMTKTSVNILSQPEKQGDLIILIDAALPVGKEGYVLNIDEVAVMRATSETGIIYAAATISQMLMQSSDLRSCPKGIMRDYPQYEIRGFMIDTARYYMNIKYLEDVTKYAGFFKMNQVHLHLNDGAGETENSFRIKSEKYPSLNNGIINTCENGETKLYTKDEFRAYQKAVKKFGIEVVPEIDSPSHCGVLVEASRSEQAKALGFQDVGINCWQLDLRDAAFQNSLKFVQSVFDEFLDGDDPVFCGSKIHFGTDEWIRDNETEAYGVTLSQRNEIMRKYMDAMINYVNLKGYTPVLWSGMNTDGKSYSGSTPVSSKALFQTWSLVFADINVALDNEYEMINSNDRDLYIVPGVTYYKNDLDIAKMYDSWEAGCFGENADVAEGHPLLKGCETAFWLDANCGSSLIDIFKLLKNQIMLITEKTWCGRKREGQTAQQYMNRVSTCANFAPGVNPERYVKANPDGLIAAYDFAQISGNTVRDLSGNGYDAVITGTTVDAVNGALVLDGNCYITLPFNTVSNPYRIEFELCVSKETPCNAVMFSGEDGILYFNSDNTGKITYQRKGYTYQFDCEVPTNKMVSFAITCDAKNCSLYFDHTLASQGRYVKGEYEFNPGASRAVYTFQLPVQKIGQDICGSLKAMKIYCSCEPSV